MAGLETNFRLCVWLHGAYYIFDCLLGCMEFIIFFNLRDVTILF